MNLRQIAKKETRFIIGLASGGSAAGIGAALVRVKGRGQDLHLKLIKHEYFPHSPAMHTRLLSVHMDARELCLLNFELGAHFANAAQTMNEFADAEGCAVDFVASSGYCAVHIPGTEKQPGGTLELGEPAVIAEQVRLPVVSDFRQRDMAAGGLGAPVEGYADWLLYRRADRTVSCLNLGGAILMTVVPPEFENIMCFDVGPGNVAIDGTARLLTKGVEEMDRDGAAAAQGVVVDEFLEYLLDHPFLAKVPPKAINRDDFSAETLLRDALAARKEHAFNDLMATVTAAVAYSVIRAHHRFVKPQHQIKRLIVSGGGARNRTLVRHLKKGFTGVALRVSDQYGIPSAARAPVAAAILGNETIFGRTANVPHASGARRAVVMGRITPD